MTKTSFLVVFLYSLSLLSVEDSPICQKVRLGDIGWSDVTATTAITSVILTTLGYEPYVSVLSTPVTLQALKNDDLDVFLGNWMPTQEADIRPYLNEGSVVQLKTNLTGAVFTLAVPDYVYDQGVKSFDDLRKFSEQFNRTIYGIEAGNDGNRLLRKMINDNAFSLKDWKVMESSEQGMLASVKSAISRGDYIVFLGWAPHPMNLSIKMKYLSGGDEYFGPNLGTSQVYTVVRRNFSSDCNNLAQLFKNLVFSVDMENQVMSLILDKKLSPTIAATMWLKENQAVARSWLMGVSSYDGRSSLTAFEKWWAVEKPAQELKKASFGRIIEHSIAFLTHKFSPHFRMVSVGLETTINSIVKLLLFPHWAIVIAIFALIAYAIHRSWKMVAAVSLGLLIIVNLDLWTETIKTLVLVLVSSLVAIGLGIPLGVAAARRPWFYRLLSPLLDLMQTVPTFVYLIPTLMLFGLGVVPGIISTVIFAIAAPIRLTYLGLKSVPLDLVEASVAFGATRMQTLVKVEIPFALPSIMTGFTQCIMLSLSMVVIAALVGADGLGAPVVRALNTVNVVQGFESGMAIVILAILLDRTLNVKRAHSPKG